MTENQTKALRLGITMMVCLVISRLSVGSFVFAIPLLVSSRSFGAPLKRGAIFLLEALGVLAWDLIASIGSFNLSVTVISVFVPLMICLCCFVYTVLETRMRRLYRVFVCSALCSILIAAFAYWFSTDTVALAYIDSMLKISAQLAGLSESFDLEILKGAMLRLLSCCIAGFGVAVIGFNILFSESVLEVRNANYGWGSDFKLPEWSVWVFILAWALALVGYLAKLGAWLSAICWNAALVVTAFFAAQGLAIVLFRQRRRNNRATMQALLSLMLFLGFIPGANALVLIVLPLLGVLETWIGFRNTENKEISI